jgi:hypothetical protein
MPSGNRPGPRSSGPLDRRPSRPWSPLPDREGRAPRADRPDRPSQHFEESSHECPPRPLFPPHARCTTRPDRPVQCFRHVGRPRCTPGRLTSVVLRTAHQQLEHQFDAGYGVRVGALLMTPDRGPRRRRSSPRFPDAVAPGRRIGGILHDGGMVTPTHSPTDEVPPHRLSPRCN